MHDSPQPSQGPDAVHQDLTALRTEVFEMRNEVDNLILEVQDLHRHGFVEAISLNDVTSLKPYERLVTMTDAQRLLTLATIRNQETRSLISAASLDRRQFWKSRWGIASLVSGILFGLIVAAGTVYDVFFGLSHSVIGH